MAEKKVTLTIRLYPEEKMRIKRCAGELGLSVSEYIMDAVRDRLKRDEIPIEERSDIDLLEGALTKITAPSSKSAHAPELDDKSLMELIGDYVEKDE